MGEHMLLLADELRDRYDISFVCSPTRGGAGLLGRAEHMGLETFPLPMRDDGRRHTGLYRWLRDRDFSIFHAHAGIGWEAQAGCYTARAVGIPVVLRTEHLPYLITDRREQREYHRLVPVVDCILCVSGGVCASHITAGVPVAKLDVIQNGIRPRVAAADGPAVRHRLGLPEDARIVLSVGRMTDQKGYPCLAEAAVRIVARRPDAYFVWVGDGPRRIELQRYVARLGLVDRVCFAGERSDVPDILVASDIFVLPSLFEGLPLVVLEAMAAGLPVVGTRVCGMTEAVLDGVTGRLVAPADPDALACAIAEVLEQPGMAAEWGASGRSRVLREFAATRMAKETAALYDDLLQRHASGVGPSGRGSARSSSASAGSLHASMIEIAQ